MVTVPKVMPDLESPGWRAVERGPYSTKSSLLQVTVTESPGPGRQTNSAGAGRAPGARGTGSCGAGATTGGGAGSARASSAGGGCGPRSSACLSSQAWRIAWHSSGDAASRIQRRHTPKMEGGDAGTGVSVRSDGDDRPAGAPDADSASSSNSRPWSCSSTEMCSSSSEVVEGGAVAAAEVEATGAGAVAGGAEGVDPLAAVSLGVLADSSCRADR